MSAIAAPLHESDTRSLEDFGLDFEVPCEVNVPQADHSMESHPADWAILKSCGCTTNVCDFIYQTRFQMQNDGGVWCTRCEALYVRLVHAIPIRGS
jgi:hypothetical protein